jgi:hypothetical protein
MDLRLIFRRLWPTRWQRPGKHETISMVLLLRKPHLFSEKELRLARERAWSTSFAGGDDSKHFVVQSGPVTMMKVGPHLLNFFTYPHPFIDDPETNVEWLPQASQRKAWVEHSGCVGIDYVNQDSDLGLILCVLSRLAAELLDDNCTGVYVPYVSSLTSHVGSIYEDLRAVASSRLTGATETT